MAIRNSAIFTLSFSILLLACQGTQFLSTNTPIPTMTTPIASELETCPTNVAKWEFTDLPASLGSQSKWKKITPSCVYEKLQRAVAWSIAVENGYTSPEAANRLRLSGEPWRIGKWTGASLTVTLELSQGPTPLLLATTAYMTGLHSWRVNKSGSYVDKRILGGCYHTASLVGTKWESWGDPYPAICVVWVVSPKGNGLLINVLDKPLIKASPTFTQERDEVNYEFYGYDATTNEWKFLGRPSSKALPPRPTDDVQPYLSFAEWHEQVVWDAEWNKNIFDMPSVALPEGWRTFPPDNIAAILEIMNSEYDKERAFTP